MLRRVFLFLFFSTIIANAADAQTAAVKTLVGSGVGYEDIVFSCAATRSLGRIAIWMDVRNGSSHDLVFLPVSVSFYNYFSGHWDDATGTGIGTRIPPGSGARQIVTFPATDAWTMVRCVAHDPVVFVPHVERRASAPCKTVRGSTRYPNASIDTVQLGINKLNDFEQAYPGYDLHVRAMITRSGTLTRYRVWSVPHSVELEKKWSRWEHGLTWLPALNGCSPVASPYVGDFHFRGELRATTEPQQAKKVTYSAAHSGTESQSSVDAFRRELQQRRIGRIVVIDASESSVEAESIDSTTMAYFTQRLKGLLPGAALIGDRASIKTSDDVVRVLERDNAVGALVVTPYASWNPTVIGGVKYDVQLRVDLTDCNGNGWLSHREEKSGSSGSASIEDVVTTSIGELTDRYIAFLQTQSSAQQDRLENYARYGLFANSSRNDALLHINVGKGTATVDWAPTIGSAAAAGVMINDRVTAINGTPTAGLDQSELDKLYRLDAPFHLEVVHVDGRKEKIDISPRPFSYYARMVDGDSSSSP